MAYPEKIAKGIAQLRHIGHADGSDAAAAAANFCCGSVVRFSLSINTQNQFVTGVNFSSSGCGFMLAAADVLAQSLIKKRLIDLHGLSDADLNEQIQKKLGDIPSERRECINACTEALRAAFADFRTKKIEEFQGEKALICTCFGVTEETIESYLSETGAIPQRFFTVEEITQATRAGSGCGSCRMLIQEMLDGRIDSV